MSGVENKRRKAHGEEVNFNLEVIQLKMRVESLEATVRELTKRIQGLEIYGQGPIK